MDTMGKINVESFTGTQIEADGIISDDKKFIIASIARRARNSTPTTNDRGNTTLLLARVDTSVYLNDNGKPGVAVIQYLSSRLMRIKSKAGDFDRVFSIYNNDDQPTNAQKPGATPRFKNLLIGDSLLVSIKKSVQAAISDLSAAVAAGKEPSFVVGNDEYRASGDILAEKAYKEMAEKPPIGTAGAAAGSSESSAKAAAALS
jgi:hypothetical protein